MPAPNEGVVVTPIPDKVRIGKTIAVGLTGLVVFCLVVLSWARQGQLEKDPFSVLFFALLPSGPLFWWAWTLWHKTEKRTFVELLEILPEQDRKKKVVRAMALMAFAMVFTWVMQFLAGELGKQWFLAIFWLVPFIAYSIVVWFTKSRSVLAPEAVVAKAQENAEAFRKNAEMEEKWWFRYPLAVLMVVGAGFLLDKKPGLWWLAGILFIVALFNAKELALVLLGLGAVALLISGIAALPTSIAVIVGACIIAYAIHTKDLPNTQRWGFIGKFLENRKQAKALEELAKQPIVVHARDAIGIYWTNNHELIKDFTPAFVQERGQLMMQTALDIGAAPNPVKALREALVNAVHEAARFQVLIIPPAPEADPTELRGQPGITGELKANLVKVVESDEELRKWMADINPNYSATDVWDACLFRYRLAFATAHVVMYLRNAYGDYTNPDWFKQLYTLTCAFWEHIWRGQSGMPTALDPDPFRAIVMNKECELFFEAVLECTPDPQARWRELVAEFYAEQG